MKEKTPEERIAESRELLEIALYRAGLTRFVPQIVSGIDAMILARVIQLMERTE